MCNIDYNNFIAITNRELCRGDYLEQIERIAKLSPKAIILREKDLSKKDYLSLAKEVNSICKKAGVELFIHSHTEIAGTIGCGNIHLSILGARDKANELAYFEKISISCHSLEDVKEAERLHATQIVLGTIFETECKKGLKGKGTDFVRFISEQTTLPVYAIGGIKPENIKAVMDAGAKGGCMMSGFMTI